MAQDLVNKLPLSLLTCLWNSSYWLPSSLLFTVNTVIGCQLFQRHDAGTPYTEWIGKDHTGVGLRKILSSWSLQNINALTFTFRTRGFPKISLTWKVSKMMHLPRCILILLAGKKYVLLFVDFPALFSSLGYTSTYTRRRFSAECCVQLVEFLNFCPILIVISANFIFNKALTTAINVSFFNPSLQIVRVDTSFLAYILIDFVMNIFFSFSGENLVFQGSSS